MSMIHHTAKGAGAPPFVLVHGFACASGDWDAQVSQRPMSEGTPFANVLLVAHLGPTRSDT